MIPQNSKDVREFIKMLMSPEHRARKAEQKAKEERHDKKMAEIRAAMQSKTWKSLREEIEGKIEAIKEMLVDPELTEDWRKIFVGCVMAYRYVIYLDDDEEARSVKTKQEKTNAT